MNDPLTSPILPDLEAPRMPSVPDGHASVEAGADARTLSDHENRLHFFERFAKGAPKLAVAYPRVTN